MPATEPNLFGNDLFGDPIAPPSRGKMADDFIVPPFTVLNAREGWWQSRKRAWIGQGIKSELGRGANTLGLSPECEEYRNNKYGSADGESWTSGSGNTGKAFRLSRVTPKTNQLVPGGAGTGTAWRGAGGAEGDEGESGTSIFDPVLCELAYRWWCPEAGQIIDPFAGGSVRGIVAALLGRQYWGCDLRAEQIEANTAQASAICPESPPVWACGDCREVMPEAPPGDFLFTCPPYGDLERYSDDPRDLSTMDYPRFVEAYREAVAASCARLKADRFACVVVGDFRDNAGHYRNFVSDTIAAFRGAGLELYNEAILVTQVGSLPVRVGKQWKVGRKLGKTHQNVLVFVKGRWRAAAAACEIRQGA
jgi:DNA modification methylase